MSVNTTATLVIPALYATSGTLNTTATSGSGLAVGKLVDLQDGVNEVIGLLTAVGSTSIAFRVLEVRQGAVGNTLASGARVQLGYTASGAILKDTDIDWSTFAANKFLAAITSNGYPFSFSTVPSGSLGTVAIAQGGTGQTTAAAALNALGVSAGGNVESQTFGSTIVKRGIAAGVKADGSADTTVTFGADFPGGVDQILLSIRLTNSSTLKVLCPTYNTEGVHSFKIHVEGGDASSTASVVWVAYGH